MNLHGIKKVITHKGCPDGIASAMIVRDVKPSIEVLFVNPGSSELRSIKPSPGLLYLDICPPENIDDHLSNGTIVIDHHDSSKDIVLKFERKGIFRSGIGISAAVLTYEYIWKYLREFSNPTTADQHIGMLAKLVGIRDTFDKKSIYWHESCVLGEVLRFFPVEHWLEKFPKQVTSQEMELGEIILQNSLNSVLKIAQGSHCSQIKNFKTAIFDGEQGSDVAEHLRKEGINIIMGFKYAVENSEPKIIVSIYSDDSFNSFEFAASNGGGGHFHAAGFSIKINRSDKNPYVYLEELLEGYLNRLEEKSKPLIWPHGL